MKRLLITAVALTLTAMPGVALAKRDSGARAMPARAMSGYNWGPRQNGRWIGGWRAPGGWSAYRPAVRGYVLPRYWINPRFYIANWGRYGLYQPAPGYGWSRYYDDMVLTNAAGHIIDSRHDFDWDRYDRYDADGWADDSRDGDVYAENHEDGWGYREDGRGPPSPRRYKDRDGGLGGALIGGATGAAAGAIIGAKGDRAEGAVIGGVAGAVAGGLIDKGDRAGRGPKVSRNKRTTEVMEHREGGDYGASYDRGYDDAPPPVEYSDRGDSRHWGGRYEERRIYRHDSQSPAVSHHGGATTHVYSHGGYGYGFGGGETIITIHSAPVVTTTTVTTEEVVYAAAPRKRYAAKRKAWKPRPKPRCVC